MNGLIKTILSDKILRWSNILTFIFLLLMGGVIALLFRNLPPFIPVYNQMPWGEARLGRTIEIFIPVGIAFGFFIVNIIFSHIIYQRLPLISRALCVTSFLVSLITFIFVVRTIQLIY